MATGDEKRSYRVEALSKGLRVLALFDEKRPTLRLSDVVAETGMLMPTVYRIAMTLQDEGYLEQLAGGQYRPGTKVLRLGYASLKSLDLVELASTRLERLAQETGETVNLAKLTGDKVLYLLRFRNGDLVTANIQVGSMLPAVYTSIGKVLLASLPPGDLSSRLTDSSFSASHGPRAVTGLKELQRQLTSVRTNRYAIQDEEVAYGLRSIAAPINNGEGVVVAAANVAVNAREWTTEKMLEKLAPALLRATAEISELISTP